MKKYFLHDGSKQAGPFDIEELKSKNLTKDTPVWFDGLDEWTTIGKVEELSEVNQMAPPTFKTPLASPPPVAKSNTEPKIIIENSKKSNAYIQRLLILVGIIVFTLIGVNAYQKNDRENTINVIEDIRESIRNNITSYVIAERNAYRYNDLGGISNLKISISNNTDYLLDNVKVKVIYIKANGDVWDSKIIDFNLIAPHVKSTLKVDDTSRGTSVQYEIVSIKSAALGLN